MIAEVIPLARLPKNLSCFDYEVPENFLGQIKIGQLVKIPFRGKNVSGLVFTLKEKPAEKLGAVKPIIKIIDTGENLDPKRLSLLTWLANYYLVSPALILKTFLPEPPQKASTFKSKSKLTATSLGVAKTDTGEIQEKVREIYSSEKSFFLFHYQNYKNKTAVLLKIIEKIVTDGKSVLIFEPQVPDVAALLPYFIHLFHDKVATLHGEMSKTEYWQEWQKIKNGEAKIVIGTRSALFAPIQNIGLIIMDNEESLDFKQSDQNPRYDVREAAIKLGKLTNAKIIFTSPSPRPETYFLAKNSPEAQYLSPKNPSRTPVTTVDMNDEIKNKNFSSLSEKIKISISETLKNKQKIVLLLNRRGLSTVILCRDCNHIFRCKNCELPLVCHDDECNLPSQFICHNCGAKEPIQLVCPKCRGADIKYIGVGTQTVEKEIKKLFPNSKIVRVDIDTKIPESDSQILNSEIFIGTQFFIRNYLTQIKNIGLVGVISADTLLSRPDFRSGEKTFNWLTGLINFSGQIKSPLIIQTFFPNNFVIQSAVDENYENFYQKEIEDRKNLHYPPFGKLVKLVYGHPNEKKCTFELIDLFNKINTTLGRETEISRDEKPKRKKQKFYATIIIKFQESLTPKVLNFLKTAPDGWTIDIDPESIL